VDEHDQAMGVIVNATGRLYECPRCARVMWKKPGEDRYRIYTEAKE
jgi:hypothetical protein